MGGSQRIGKFVGPLLAAAATASFGLAGAFYIHIVVAVIASGHLRDGSADRRRQGTRGASGSRSGSWPANIARRSPPRASVSCC